MQNLSIVVQVRQSLGALEKTVLDLDLEHLVVRGEGGLALARLTLLIVVVVVVMIVHGASGRLSGLSRRYGMTLFLGRQHVRQTRYDRLRDESQGLGALLDRVYHLVDGRN